MAYYVLLRITTLFYPAVLRLLRHAHHVRIEASVLLLPLLPEPARACSGFAVWTRTYALEAPETQGLD